MTRSTISIPFDEPVIRVQRVFDAPRELMFRLITDPFHLAQFLGPRAVVNDIREMDVRPGGYWRNVMRFPDGSEERLTSMFIEVVEPERIVYRDAPLGSTAALADLPPAQLVTTLSLDEAVAGTRFTAEVKATTIAVRNGALAFAEGMSQGNEKLADYLGVLGNGSAQTLQSVLARRKS
jgi:uncharacterized protein YndB with AHSA1/START domain